MGKRQKSEKMKILREDGFEEYLPEGFQAEDNLGTPRNIRDIWGDIDLPVTKKRKIRHRRSIKFILDKP